MDLSSDLPHVLAAWPVDCLPTKPPVRWPGGMSGSMVWRVETERGPLCLRRWPVEHPSRERLRLIHAVLRHVANGGVKFIPLPITNSSGETFIHHDNHFWELTPWLPGTAISSLGTMPLEYPSACLIAAMRALAQFHNAAESFPTHETSPRPSPGIRERLEKLTVLMHGGAERLAAAVAANRGVWPELAALGEKFLAESEDKIPPLLAALQHAAGLNVLQQPCIRDIHREHVLFEYENVSGIIDFGALRIDHPSGDIARLLGSVAKFGSPQWEAGLRAYGEVRPLVGPQPTLIEAFHRSGVVLAGIHWLQWVFVEDRRFDDRPAVLRRFGEILEQLREL